MIIYKTIFPNGKIYIGQSEIDNPNYFGSGSICLKAVRKYGRKNLIKVILKDNIKSQRKTDLLEAVYIKKFDSTNQEIGYNILPGTANNFGSICPMKIKEVQIKNSKSQIRSYKKNPDRRKELSKIQTERMKSEELREQISKKMSENFKGKNNPIYGMRRITNGKHNTNLHPNDNMPEGYWFGITRNIKK